MTTSSSSSNAQWMLTVSTAERLSDDALLAQIRALAGESGLNEDGMGGGGHWWHDLDFSGPHAAILEAQQVIMQLLRDSWLDEQDYTVSCYSQES